MKKFTPPEQDDSSLSPWQKENLKFLKKHQYDDFSNLHKEKKLDTTIENTTRDVFEKEEQPQEETTFVKRYIKPTEIKDDDLIDDWDDPFSDFTTKTEKPEEIEVKVPEKVKEENEEPEVEDRPSLRLLKDDDPVELEKEYEEEVAQEEIQKPPFVERIKDWYTRDAFLPAKVRHQLYLIIAFFVIALGVTFYYMTPLSSLAKVNVTGNDMVSKQTIIKASQFKTGQRLWHQYFNRQTAIDKIDQLSGIKNVDVTLNNWNQLTIHVTEYQVVGYVSVDKIKYSPVLSDGTIIRSHIDKKKPSGTVLYTGFKQGSLLKTVIKSYQKVPANVQSLITQIALKPSNSNPQLVVVYMKDGNQVKIDGGQLQKLKYYPQVSAQMENKGVIDMEVGIYSYPYGNDDTTRKNKNNVADGTVIDTTESSSSSSSTQEIVIPEN